MVLVVERVTSKENVAARDEDWLSEGDAVGVEAQVGRNAWPGVMQEEGHGQMVQLEAPASENVPTGQSVAFAEAKRQKEPAEHRVQLVAPAAEYVPTGQGVGVFGHAKAV
jgi:hypothetical protein